MASDDFYLVLPSNASMTTHPNNTLAQYITNLPRRICLSGEWECGLTEIHYPHDWYNVRNARLTVEHHGNMETDAYFEDGYYGSAKTLVRALNDGVKGGSVKFSHDPVTQKVCVHMKGDTTFALYGDLPDVLGFGRGDGVVIRTSNRKTVVQGHSIVDLRRGFESLYVYSSIVEPRIVGDKIAPLLRIVPITGRHGEMVAARFDHVQYMPVLSREFEAVEIEIRGALALGNRALKTGAQIAGDVLSGENIRTAAKRRTNTAGRDLLQSLLTTSSPPGKRVKRAAPKKRIKPRRAEPVKRAAKRRRIAEADVFS